MRPQERTIGIVFNYHYGGIAAAVTKGIAGDIAVPGAIDGKGLACEIHVVEGLDAIVIPAVVTAYPLLGTAAVVLDGDDIV